MYYIDKIKEIKLDYTTVFLYHMYLKSSKIRYSILELVYKTTMGFPKNIAEEAIIKCGRRCCLCQKFCGNKIETHHIIPKSEGGDDSFDNCIPLCFDCHAEVKSYNPKHPKGRAFTYTELKAHRDRFYNLIEKSVINKNSTNEKKNLAGKKI